MRRLMCCWFVLLVGIGCGQHYEEGAHPPPVPPPQTQLPDGHPPLQAQGMPANTTDQNPVGQAVFSGTIRIDGDIAVQKQATLFIIARPAPTGGPPLMVKRMPVPDFPFKYSLMETDGMTPGQKVDLEGIEALYIVARIDIDGNAGPLQPGDMEGACIQNPVAVGAQDADIAIKTVR